MDSSKLQGPVFDVGQLSRPSGRQNLSGDPLPEPDLRPPDPHRLDLARRVEGHLSRLRRTPH